MAKLSTVNKNNKRARMVKSQSKARKALREQSLDLKLSPEDRAVAFRKLQKLAKNGAANRHVVRCSVTGRSKGVYRKFRLSRMKFREMALDGLLPGVVKASW
ncbi:MAG: 30S ribosomal protein S14 [Proteobacteria bacterium]|jgi:small subunit ribosomal protein S14|nr:30S ribosomal protein S14 [Pseudomonadota bacterium]